MDLCTPLPLSGSWIKWLAFNKQNTAKVMGYYFWDQAIKDCNFHLSHPFSLALSNGNQLPYCELPCGEAHGARNWETASSQQPARNWSLSAATCEELNPTNTHTSESGSRSFPRCLASYLYRSLGDTLKQRTQLSQGQIPAPQKLWNNNYFCCKPLHFRVTYYSKQNTNKNKETKHLAGYFSVWKHHDPTIVAASRFLNLNILLWPSWPLLVGIWFSWNTNNNN